MELEPGAIAWLAAAAFATAVLSAIVGMAGGIILLSVMLLFLEPLTVIPLHGVVQLVSNGSRTWIQRQHVEWSITWRYAVLLLPAGYLGILVALQLPAQGTRLAIGLFVLGATWRPAWLMLGAHPEQTNPPKRFFALGGAVGCLNPVIGATGPLIAPFFLNLGFSRQTIVGTKAACQALGHVAKVILFGAVVAFAYADWLLPLLLLSVMVIAGTWAGSRMLERVNDRAFTILFKTILTLVALRLVLVEIWGLAQGS